MSNYFAAGQAAFSQSKLNYIGSSNPSDYSQHIEAAKGFATAMAASSTETTDDKSTISQAEFKTRFNTSDELTKSLFKNQATMSVHDMGFVILSLDAYDQSELDGKLDSNYLAHLKAIATGDENGLEELIGMKPALKANLTAYQAITDKSKAEIIFSDSTTAEGRWYDAREWMEAFSADGKITATQLQTALGVNAQTAEQLIKTYGGVSATTLNSNQAADLLVKIANNDNTFSKADRTAAEAALSTTARGTTTTPPAGTTTTPPAGTATTPPAGTTTTPPAGTTTTTPAAASRTRGNGLFGWRNWFKKKDKPADNTTGNAPDSTAALSNTDAASPNADAKTPGTIKLFGKEIKTKNLLLFGGLGVGLLALLGVFKKKQQPLANAGACCPPSPYAEILSFGGASSSRGAQGPLNVMQF